MMELRFRPRNPQRPKPVAARTGGPLVLLLGSTSDMAAAVEFVARGRYRCRPLPDEIPQVVVLDPTQVPEIDDLRQRFPAAAVVIWDRSGVTRPADVARAHRAGVCRYVSAREVRTLVAQLDAVLEPAASPRPAAGTRSHSPQGLQPEDAEAVSRPGQSTVGSLLSRSAS